MLDGILEQKDIVIASRVCIVIFDKTYYRIPYWVAYFSRDGERNVVQSYVYMIQDSRDTQ